MIFYNGFNLMVDVIVGALVFYFTRRASWWEGYHAGIEDTNAQAEYAMDSYLEAQAEAY